MIEEFNDMGLTGCSNIKAKSTNSRIEKLKATRSLKRKKIEDQS